MKKFFKSCFAVALLAGAMALTGCGADDPAKPLNVSGYTATINGNVVLMNDETATTPVWVAAPAEIVVEVTIANGDLVSSGSGNYVTKAKYDATTGKYSVTVPTPAPGTAVSATVEVKDFLGQVKRTEGAETVTSDVVWNKNSTTVSVKAGEVKYDQNITFQGQGTGAGQYKVIKEVAGEEI